MSAQFLSYDLAICSRVISCFGRPRYPGCRPVLVHPRLASSSAPKMNPFTSMSQFRRPLSRQGPNDTRRTPRAFQPSEAHQCPRIKRRSSSVPAAASSAMRTSHWSVQSTTVRAPSDGHTCGVIFGARPLRSALKSPDRQRSRRGGPTGCKKVVTFNSTTIVFV